MRMTAHSDYALRTLIYLGLRSDRLITSEEISVAYGVSKNHLMKVIQGLQHNGYIETIRGRHGGLRLAKEPCEIGIGAVVRAMEDDFAIVECMRQKDKCVISGACQIKRVMREALSAWFNVLDQYTLAELLKRPASLKLLLSLNE